MRKLVVSLTCGMLLVAGSALGDEVEGKLGMRESNNYGPAGCGLGSLIFAPDSGFTQIFAATTNGTSGNQTFAITTGTSNCDDSAGGTASAKAFIETNRAAVAKDIARGRGETLMSLNELAGCSNASAVGQTLQKNFKRIFPTSRVTDGQVSDNVLSILRENASLSCTNLG